MKLTIGGRTFEPQGLTLDDVRQLMEAGKFDQFSRLGDLKPAERHDLMVTWAAVGLGVEESWLRKQRGCLGKVTRLFSFLVQDLGDQDEEETPPNVGGR